MPTAGIAKFLERRTLKRPFNVHDHLLAYFASIAASWIFETQRWRTNSQGFQWQHSGLELENFVHVVEAVFFLCSFLAWQRV